MYLTMVSIKEDADLKSSVDSNFQRFWVKAKEWSFTECTLWGPAVAGSRGWHEILKRGKVYLGCGGREPKAQWIILCSKSRKEQFFPSFFSVKYCSSGASKGIWVWCKLKWGARALRQQSPPCSLWNQPLLMAGEWLQELFCDCIPFRLTAKFGFHLKLVLLACTLCSRGKETSRGKILLVRVSLGSFYLGPSCNQNLNVYLEVWGP